MSDVKVNVYTVSGTHIGYFINPQIDSFPEGDYEITGYFFAPTGQVLARLEFNPQTTPYVADTSQVEGLHLAQLFNVYVQRGRQPVQMTATQN